MRLLKRCTSILLAAATILTIISPAFAQYPPAPPPLSLGQLEVLVSRIALYPDPLLVQVLAAATYPDQIHDAAWWADQHSYLRADDLALAGSQDDLPWDLSVQALLPFPYVLDVMNQDIRWTTELGNAVLSQRGDVMDAIQTMRQRALDLGYLQTNQRIRVIFSDSRFIEIQPVNPGFVYVPYYDPSVIFAPRRSDGVFARGEISFSVGVPIPAAFGVWGWGSGGPRFGWSSRALIIDRGPWNRTWSNRQLYEHPYAAPRDRTNAREHFQEQHRLLQRDEQYYRRQREHQSDPSGSGLGHINQEENRRR